MYIYQPTETNWIVEKDTGIIIVSTAWKFY